MPGLPITPDDFNEATVATERHRRRQAQARTIGERMELFERLQAAAFEVLQSNPEAYAALVKRNHHKRRISNVKRLEAEMLRPREKKID